MLDLEKCKYSASEFYANLSTDPEDHTVNGIKQFAFSDIALVPELFRNFAMEYFDIERYRQVDLDELNRVLNELWDGPGSAAKISDIIWDIRIARRENPTKKGRDALKGIAVPTIDSDLQVETDDE